MSWDHDFDRPFVDREARPLPTYLTIGDAKRKAYRAFWRGIVIGGVITAGVFIAGSAFAGDTADWGGTGCKLVPVAGQAHVAEVQCHNVHTSGAPMNEGMMEADGISVHLVILHGPGDKADSFIVTPPDGYFADPAMMFIDEWDGATALIFPWVGA